MFFENEIDYNTLLDFLRNRRLIIKKVGDIYSVAGKYDISSELSVLFYIHPDNSGKRIINGSVWHPSTLFKSILSYKNIFLELFEKYSLSFIVTYDEELFEKKLKNSEYYTFRKKFAETGDINLIEDIFRLYMESYNEECKSKFCVPLIIFHERYLDEIAELVAEEYDMTKEKILKEIFSEDPLIEPIVPINGKYYAAGDYLWF